MRSVIAYLDANSGSLLASALAAGTAGVGVAAKLGWRRVKSRVGRGDGGEPRREEEAPAGEA